MLPPERAPLPGLPGQLHCSARGLGVKLRKLLPPEHADGVATLTVNQWQEPRTRECDTKTVQPKERKNLLRPGVI